MFLQELEVGQKFTFADMLAYMKDGKLHCGSIKRGDTTGKPVVLMKLGQFAGAPARSIPYVILKPWECGGHVTFAGLNAEVVLVSD